MRIRVYCVRHAEAKSNVDPHFEGEDVLTEVGEKQAAALANRFKEIPVEKIYTSKILRAKMTAREIEKTTGVAPIVLENVGERKGEYLPNAEYVHVETFEELKIRLAAVKTFLENQTEKHVVLVSHAIFLKSLAAYIMLGDSLTEESLEKVIRILTIDNTAISKFMYTQEKAKWHIESWNDQVHLV